MSELAETQAERRERDRPETLRLKSIAPAITVNDLDASLRWYVEVAGFYLSEKFENEGKMMGAALVAGESQIMLSQDDGAKGERIKGQGVRLYLTTSQDIDDVAAAVRERGGELASEPADMPWGARAFNLVDPDGFMLTITS